MAIKQIYVTHQEGLEVLAPYIVDAIDEVMDSFPSGKRYKEYFPITNLGNWNGNGNTREPYGSIEWYIERAKRKAIEQGRWQERGQISADQLYEDLSNDPYAKKIPQYSILITKHDLYGTSGGRLLNFCNGITKEGHFAIVSTARFIDGNNHLDIDRFQTVVMHEFGHLISLTPNGRRNSYEQLGTHCANGDIMAQDMTGTGIAMTQNRLQRRMMGLPPICSDCIEAGCRFLDREIYNFMARNNLHNLTYNRN